MLNKIIISLMTVFVSLNAVADIGIDTLALPKYSDVVVENLPKDYWFSSFAETFGDAYPHVEKVIKSGKPKGYRIQLLWSDAHEFGDKDIAKITALSKKYQILAVRYPNVKCELSPFCEHKLSNPDKYLDIVKKNAPNCEVVNTVWTGALSKKYKNEIHGNKKAIPSGRYNFSYDGEEMRDRDVPADIKKHSKAEIFWAWTSWANGKWTIAKDKNGKPKDPTPREKRIDYFDKKKFIGIVKLTEKKAPAEIKIKTTTYKVFADDHGIKAKDVKANKPVVLAHGLQKVKITTMDNRTLVDFGESRSYEDGRRRAYSKLWGHEIASLAVKLQGHAQCKLWINGKEVGTIDPSHRQNQWR